MDGVDADLLVRQAEEGVKVMLRNARADLNSDDKPWRKRVEKDMGEGLTLTVYDSDVPGSPLLRFKGVLEAPFPPDVVVQLVNDHKARLAWDGNIAQLDTVVLRQHDPFCFVLHSATKSVGPVSARDFVDITAIVALEGGSYASGGCGYVDEKRYPARSGFVRGSNSPGGGWYFESVGEGSGTRCRISYVIHSDLKGWMPSVIINNAITGSYVSFYGDMLKYIRENPAAVDAARKAAAQEAERRAKAAGKA
jgi:hypothetical protein